MAGAQGWIDKEDEPLDDEDIGEDAEYLEQAERFEARYNHRFEVGLPAGIHSPLAACMPLLP